MQKYWKNEHIRGFFLVFLMIFLRYCCYGFTYWPQLDDYIQYHNFAFPNDDIWSFIRMIGLLTARPLAGLADVFLWCKFWGHMMWVTAILSGLQAAAGLLLQAVFRRHFHAGYGFLAVFALLPLGFEGGYWVSASSRILVGLFFAALSLWLFQKFLDSGRALPLLGWILCQLAAYGFYEQILVLSCAMTLLLGLWSWRSCRGRALWALFSVVNTGLYFFLTGLAAPSDVFRQRMALILPTDSGYWTVFLPELLRQIKSVFVGGGWNTLVPAAKRGLALIVTDGLWLWAVVMALLCLLPLFSTFRKKSVAQQGVHCFQGILFGVLIALAPLAPFFILSNPWFSLRGAFPSLVGLALAADNLLFWLLSRAKGREQIYTAVLCLFSLVCTAAAVSELHDYRANTLSDQAIGQAIVRDTGDRFAFLEDAQRVRLRVGVLNLEPSYLEEQNFRWHEHISGTTESDWALTGMVRCLSEDNYFPTVCPLPGKAPMYKKWNCERSRLDTFDALYLYDPVAGALTPVTLAETGEQAYDILSPSGALLARSYEEDCIGHLELIP